MRARATSRALFALGTGWAVLAGPASTARADNETIDTTDHSVLQADVDLLRSRQTRPRLLFESSGMIGGDFGDADINWVRSKGSLSVALPVSRRLVLVPRISGQSVNWSFSGDDAFLRTGKSGRSFDDLIALSLRIDSRYRIGERWAVVANLSLASNIEDGASLADGSRWGGSLGGVYAKEGGYRVMLGVGVREKMTRDSLSIAPLFHILWRPLEWLRLETEGLGLRATARVAPGWRVFAFGGMNSERYRLDDRNGGPEGVRSGSLRDRRVAAGVGALWRVNEMLRFEFGAGAVAWQQLKVITEDNDDFDKETMNDPAAFLSLRAQIRF